MCEEKEKVGLSLYTQIYPGVISCILLCSSMATSYITNEDDSPIHHQYVPAATACRPQEEIKLSDCRAYGTTVMGQQLVETSAAG